MPGPTHAPIGRSQLVSSDVAIALTFFATALLTAYQGLQAPKLVSLGLQDTTSALTYKMPIAVGSSAFQQVVNGIRYRRLGDLILPVSTQDWGDGVVQEARVIQSDTWTGWSTTPSSMAIAASLIGEQALAKALEAGETTPSVENFVRGDTTRTALKIFGTSKPCDPLGGSSQTYDNLFASTPLTLKNVDTVWNKINTIRAQDGVHYRDLKWQYVVVGKDLELQARRYFEDQGDVNRKVIEQSGTSTAEVEKPNTARGYGIQVIASPYLTLPGVWYPVCTTATEPAAPWITLTQVPANAIPLIAKAQDLTGGGAQGVDAGFEWVVDDMTSELYKHGRDGVAGPGNVAIAAKRTVGVGITCPWQVFKCKPGA